MNEVEFKQRYLDRFAARAEASGLDNLHAVAEAKESYENCPQSEMTDEWVDNPEGAADLSFDEREVEIEDGHEDWGDSDYD